MSYETLATSVDNLVISNAVLTQAAQAALAASQDATNQANEVLDTVTTNGSDHIGFVNAPDNISRSVANKLRETVSVKDFGAVGDGITDDTAAIQKALDSAVGKKILFPPGVYIKSARNRIRGGTYLEFDPGAVVRRVGTADAWMFVNGEVGNTTYATGFDGDGDIHVFGGTFDLNGFSGRSAAAFVIGHSRRVVFEHCLFKNGWESHNIEINASTEALFFKCTFQDQGFEGASSYEVINIDSANAAGFPGFGTYDLTTDKNIVVRDCTFKNVYGGVSSHGIAVGAGQHVNLKIHGNTFENIATKAVRAQGWDECSIIGNHFRNIGHEAISILIGNRNIIKDNIIIGASTQTSGSYSAIRIQGDENLAYDNIITDGGYTNKFPYSYGIASGNKNRIGTRSASFGSSGIVSDNGTLSQIDNRTLLWSGASTPVGTVITLSDSINNYDHLEISCGSVTGGLFQSGISRPFARRNWATGIDYVGIATAQGRWVASVTSLTTLTVTTNSDHLRFVYGVSQ